MQRLARIIADHSAMIHSQTVLAMPNTWPRQLCDSRIAVRDFCATVRENDAVLSRRVCLVSYRQLPPWPDEMARVSVWDPLQIILMFRLRCPKGTRRGHLGNHSPRPQARRVDIGDGVLGDAPLLVAGREDGGAVAGAHVVAL